MYVISHSTQSARTDLKFNPQFYTKTMCDFSELNVRLVGAPISNAGRVEVFYAGVWGTVNSRGWDINATHVVCRQLGYPLALSSGYNNQFGIYTGPVWFTNMKCLGNETNFGECSKDVYGRFHWTANAATALCKLPHESGEKT